MAAFIAGRAISDLEIDDISRRAIDELMRDAGGGKAGAHAGRQRDLALIGDESRMTFDDVDELVLPAVTMQEGGFAARPQSREIDAEILEAEEIAQWPLLALAHAAEERLRIVRWLGAQRRRGSGHGDGLR